MGKILLVEDDNNLREIYEARLQAEGYNIIAAKDGEEALVLAKRERPDLVISDVMMPKISGFEMLDILRNTEGLKDVKVIMLTALGQSDDQQRANRLGADHYLVKSQVTLEDIVKVAHELLQDETPEITSPPPAAPTPEPVAPAPAPAPVAPAPAMPAPIAPAPAPTPSMPLASPPAGPPVMPLAMPPAAPAAPANNGGSVAQSAAQEEASVEAKIEDFISGATSNATEPLPTPEPVAPAPAPAPVAPAPAMPAPIAPAPAPNMPPDSTPSPVAVPAPVAPTVQAAAASANDDKVIADAVNNLIADTTPQAAPSLNPMIGPISGGLPSSSNSITPTPNVAGGSLVSPAATTAPSIASGNGSVTIANKKIIEPLDSEPKKDLNTLLALEEAKETSGTPVPPPPAPSPAPNPLAPPPQPPATPAPQTPPPPAPSTPAGPTTPPTPPPNPLDPNSIAL